MKDEITHEDRVRASWYEAGATFGAGFIASHPDIPEEYKRLILNIAMQASVRATEVSMATVRPQTRLVSTNPSTLISMGVLDA